MSNLGRQIPISSQSMTIVADMNFAEPLAGSFGMISVCSSMSYSLIANAAMFLPVDAADAEDLPSPPVSRGAVRVINSILAARVPDSALERD